MRIAGLTRGILGKHFLDLEELRINCYKGVVRVVGKIQRMGYLKEVWPITDKFINDLKHEIKRIKDVKRVLFSMEGESED